MSPRQCRSPLVAWFRADHAPIVNKRGRMGATLNLTDLVQETSPVGRFGAFGDAEVSPDSEHVSNIGGTNMSPISMPQEAATSIRPEPAGAKH